VTVHWLRVRSVLREPLLHFLLLGAALFAVAQLLDRGRGGAEPSRQIQLTLDDLVQLSLSFESQWRRPPTPEELERLVESKIEEEVLYREALAMGLDRNDTIVRRRMAQKMGFLAEDVAAAHEPSTEELRSWYERHSPEFALPSRLSFRHLYFGPDRRGPRARADAEQALRRLAGQGAHARLPASFADPFMFQDYYGDRTPEQLAKEFGPQFAQAVEKLEPGAWRGPVESGYGWHLVFVDTLVPGRIPGFEEVEPDVKAAWLGDQKERARREAYRAMRAKYTVLLPAPPVERFAAAPAAPGRDATADPANEPPL
jgi:hypothetical protein